MSSVASPGRTARPTASLVPAGAEPGATTSRAVLSLETPAGRRIAVGVLLTVAGLLYSMGLSNSGWANQYYSAAAQAGASSWQAFFFGGLDPAGAITIDKPPAALWLTSLSVRTFGLSTPALLLPQALAMAAAVALLHGTVRRQARTVAGSDGGAAAVGLLAGAVLALTPVVTLMARYDNPDAVMVLLSVAAAYAVVRSVSAIESGGGWLIVCGAMLGLAFLTKLLQAWLVVPAFVAVALMAGAGSVGRRAVRAFVGGAAMVVAAGWWVLATVLTPAGARPWIGGTRHNSVLELALGYNGLGRLTGQGSSGGGGAGRGTWGRLFGTWAPEGSWLLPAALVALTAGWVLTRNRDRRDPARAGLLLWGVWLLGAGAALSSLRGISHSYYAIQLAPAIAGAVALGGALLWQRALEVRAIRARWLLVGTVAITALWSAGLLLSRPAWPLAVTPIVLGAAALVVIGLRIPLATAEAGRLRVVGAAIIVALLAGPAAWSLATAQAVHRGANVYAGPGVTAVSTPAGITADSTTGTQLPTSIADRVRAGADGYDWAAAVVGRRAADLQLASDVPVWELGGYSGRDPHPTSVGFRAAVANARVHYLVLAPGTTAPGSQADQSARWATSTFPSARVGDWTIVDLAQARER
jgi:4-amino-4-deoxy-L-arabinose transferase-like glycosyltransferase